MIRRTLPPLLALLTASCSGDRVAVTLDQATVRAIDHATLFSDYAGSRPDRPSRQVLQLTISSETDLLKFFEERDRDLQVRCSVDGNTDGKAYSGVAFAPLPEKTRTPVSRTAQSQVTPSTTRHRYTIYAFIDLKAESVEYENGKPASTLNLQSDRFESLRCHLLGVTKAPVPFPRSNEFSVSASTFHALLGEAVKH